MVKRKRQSKDVPSLLADLGSSANFVRRSAIIDLVGKSSPEVDAALEFLLKDREAAIRACAAWALGEMGLASAAKGLADCLKDMDVDVRRAAAQSLARLALPESRAVLESSSVDSDRWVGEWSRRGLARMALAPIRRRRPSKPRAVVSEVLAP